MELDFKGKKHVLLAFGGGYDSTYILLELLKQSIQTSVLFVDYDQAAQKAETQAVKYFADKYNVPIKIYNLSLDELATSLLSVTNASDDYLETAPDVEYVLEGRNVIFASLAATYATTLEADAICFGFHQASAHDLDFRDSKPTFFNNFQKILDTTYNTPEPIEFLVPLANMSYAQVIESLHTKYPDDAKHVFSCYQPVLVDNTYHACHSCYKCRIIDAIVENK